ncbi:hypothetical protein PR048_026709 [Dryococelus australis]|uniref:Uncharacterized protein n=1 Tax=Dryococelus australis TaxID=614101 RepID=A0ABQ9GM41_9NEOP|nr:hypothetical protein PR048_026709 [Dryococelus australis]
MLHLHPSSPSLVRRRICLSLNRRARRHGMAKNRESKQLCAGGTPTECALSGKMVELRSPLSTGRLTLPFIEATNRRRKYKKLNLPSIPTQAATPRQNSLKEIVSSPEIGTRISRARLLPPDSMSQSHGTTACCERSPIGFADGWRIWEALKNEVLRADNGEMRAEETGDRRENPATGGIVRHDSCMRKSGVNHSVFALVGGEQSNHSATVASNIKIYIIVYAHIIALECKEDSRHCPARFPHVKIRDSNHARLGRRGAGFQKSSVYREQRVWKGLIRLMREVLSEGVGASSNGGKEMSRAGQGALTGLEAVFGVSRDVDGRPGKGRAGQAARGGGRRRQVGVRQLCDTQHTLPSLQQSLPTQHRSTLYMARTHRVCPLVEMFIHNIAWCRTMPLVGGASRESPVSPTPSLRRRSIFTSFTLIGSQDLAVKSRPNLFTHSDCLHTCAT